jgi:hypothetical protein
VQAGARIIYVKALGLGVPAAPEHGLSDGESERVEARAEGTLGSRRLPASGAARPKTLLLAAIAIVAGAVYEARPCSGPLAEGPELGMSTIHCERRGRPVYSASVHGYSDIHSHGGTHSTPAASPAEFPQRG